MENKTEMLKNYLKRLGAGEDLEKVKADFVKNFGSVDAGEIMKAEQEILSDGTPIKEVQRLCDVHSALFHGSTKEERIANAEKAVNTSLLREEKAKKTKELVSTFAHPLYTFTKENEEIEKVIEKAKELSSVRKINDEILNKIGHISIHYAKKGDLLYPVLKVNYGISGPSDVMWSVDDEIRDEISSLIKDTNRDDKWYERLNAVLKRAQEMIYKEANILFPNCAYNFSENEWYGIYFDSKDYDECLGVKNDKWQEAEENKPESNKPAISNDVILGGGHMTAEQLSALLNTIPLEITFIDGNDINRFFNAGPKAFKRPRMAIDREVFSCHPPKVEQMVRNIVSQFKDGSLDEVPIWMEKNGRTTLVKYMAVRDENKKYLGTVELVQDMEFAKEHFRGDKN